MQQGGGGGGGGGGGRAVGMEGSLLDPEGYPRSDVDLYAVRTARNKVICESPDCMTVRGDVAM